jgi:hypothetical protein
MTAALEDDGPPKSDGWYEERQRGLMSFSRQLVMQRLAAQQAAQVEHARTEQRAQAARERAEAREVEIAAEVGELTRKFWRAR